MGKFPRKIKGFECPECNEFHETYEDAECCCPRDIEEAERWQCVDCDELHEDKEDAYHCCE